MIATPVLASVPDCGQVYIGYQRALMRVLAARVGDIVYASGGTIFVNTDLVRARSRAVRMALDNCCTHLLFWDSDVAGDCAKTLIGMLACGVDFIAAPYPRKNETCAPTHEPPLVAMGFTLLSEACMRRMWDHYYDELHFEDVVEGKPTRTVALFNLLLADAARPTPHRALLGEDFSFCERWLRIDGEIHLYNGPGAPLDHIGPHTYRMKSV
jgi:hypothetical protein